MSRTSQDNGRRTTEEKKNLGPEVLLSLPSRNQDVPIDRVIGLVDGSVIFRQDESKFVFLTPDKDRIELTNELYQPLFRTASFLSVEGRSTVVRQRFDPSTKNMIEESRLDLSNADLKNASRQSLATGSNESESLDGRLSQQVTHMVTCAEAKTFGVVYNNNLVLLRLDDDGTLRVDHSTLLEGEVIGIAARENDVVAAVYEQASAFNSGNGFGVNGKIRLYSSLAGQLLGTLELEGDFNAGDEADYGLIAFSGNGKMVAYTADDGVAFDVRVSIVPDAGSNAPPREVHREKYETFDRADSIAFDSSGSKLAVTTSNREYILDVMVFDYNGQCQGTRRCQIDHTPTICFEPGDDILMVRVRWGEGDVDDDVAELVRVRSYR